MTDKNKKYSKEEMISMTKNVMRYLDAWRLRSDEIINILGMDEKTRTRQLQLFRAGSKTLGQDKETLQRVEHIAGIVDALRTAYPMNAPMRGRWLYKPCRRFKGNTPLAIIMDEGIEGLIKARVEIDCAYGWYLSEQMKVKLENK